MDATRASSRYCVAEQRAAELGERPVERRRRRRRRAAGRRASPSSVEQCARSPAAYMMEKCCPTLGLVERRGVRRLDAVAERLEEPRRRARRGDALGVRPRTASPGAPREHADAEPPGRGADLVRDTDAPAAARCTDRRAWRPRSRRGSRRCRAPSASRRPRRRGRRALADVGAERRRGRATASGRRGRTRSPGCGSSRRRRSRARSATMPDGDRRRRAAARAAGRAARVPRVARRAVGVRLGRRQRAELGRVGPAEETKPGGAELRRRGSVSCGATKPTSRQRPRAHVVRVARGVAEEVLQEERHAAERPVRQIASPRPRRAPRSKSGMDDGVQLRVHALDARDRRVDQLERASPRRGGRARPGRWRRGRRVRPTWAGTLRHLASPAQDGFGGARSCRASSAAVPSRRGAPPRSPPRRGEPPRPSAAPRAREVG